MRKLDEHRGEHHCGKQGHNNENRVTKIAVRYRTFSYDVKAAIEPLLSRSPRLFVIIAKTANAFLVFFNISNKKMLAPHAFDIAVITSSPIASLRFTFVEIFKISSSS